MEMVNTIEKVLNKKAKLEFIPMQLGDVNRTYADISKAEKLLGYKPKTTFEQGIQKFVDWITENELKERL